MAGGKIGHHHRPKCGNHRARQIGIKLARLKSVNQPAQMMHTNAEMQFLHPEPRRVQPHLVVGGGSQIAGKFCVQCRATRPRRKERATDHRVQHPRMPRQILREAGRGCGDIDDQVDQRRVGFKQRENLHARRQAAQEPVQRHQRFVRVGGAGQTGQKHRAQPVKDRLRPV